MADEIKALHEAKRKLTRDGAGNDKGGLPSSQSLLELVSPLSDSIDWLVALLRDEEVSFRA